MRGARAHIPKLTQRQVSEALDLTESAWNRIELGARALTVAELLDAATIFKADPVELLAEVVKHRQRHGK